MDLNATNTQNTLLNYHNLLLEEDVIQNTLFVFEPGWGKVIETYSMAGANILLPNLALGSQLLVQTIIRQGKQFIATTKELWQQIKKALEVYPTICQNIKVRFINDEISAIA